MNSRRPGSLTMLALAATIAPSAAVLSGCATSASSTSPGVASGMHATSAAGADPLVPSTLVRSSALAPTDAPKTAPASGDVTALLRAVRVGRRPGYDQVVLEFLGTAVPGYRVRWIGGPVTSAQSGQPLNLRGTAHLEIVLDPASGVDMSRDRPTYIGPDRVGVGPARIVTDLVRTGDFERVLSWVVGAKRRVAFRVDVMRAPTRLVIDLYGTR